MVDADDIKDAADVRGIPKLTEATSRGWFVRVRLALLAAGIWYAIEQGVPIAPIAPEQPQQVTIAPPPADNEDAVRQYRLLKEKFDEEQKTYKAALKEYLVEKKAYDVAHQRFFLDDARVLSFLSRCVTETHIHIFERPGITAQGAWLALKDLMEPTSMMRRFTLAKKLFRELEFKDGKEKLSDFVNRAQSVFTELMPLITKFDHTMLVLAVLFALPERLFPTRDVILSSKDGSLSCSQVFQLLLGAEEVQVRPAPASTFVQREAIAMASTSSHGRSREAHPSARRSNQSYSRSSEFKGKCYNCNKHAGHKAHECPDRDRYNVADAAYELPSTEIHVMDAGHTPRQSTSGHVTSGHAYANSAFSSRY